MKRIVAYYISAHGFGHMTRSFEIIRNFSGFETHIVSGHSPETAEFLGFGGIKAASYRTCIIDSGVAQKNALEIDIGKTLDENADFIEKYSDLVEREAEFLSEKKVSAVFSDVSPLPVTTARRLNIPVWVVGNFTWDWIMEGFENYDTRFEKLNYFFKNQYILADGAYLLPFSGGFEMFGKIYKTGLVCRKPSFSSEREARAVLGLNEGQKAVVFTFGGFDAIKSLDFFRKTFRFLYQALKTGEFLKMFILYPRREFLFPIFFFQLTALLQSRATE
ncbi:hypothetical protein JXL83_06565 [candidate division WOR-3 bacterium]|nr:hypothetical protein [candidate division WOR-3 bacterium]